MKLNTTAVSVGLVILACILSGSAQQESGFLERSDLVRRRTEWFYRQRTYPLKRIPVGARLRALEQLRQIELSTVATSSTSWTLIGPRPVSSPFFGINSGRVTAIAVDPSNSSVVYLGAAEGGIWKSTNAGQTWTPLTDRQSSLAVGSIALDPSNSKIIYVGTGEENFNADAYGGSGILKSEDGGSTWTQIPGPFVQTHIGGLAVHPTNGQILLASVSSGGIYRSLDGGLSWTNVISAFAGTSVLFDPQNGGVAYSAADGAVYKSNDAGGTWVQLTGTGNNTLPTTNIGRIALAIAPSSSATLYAGLVNTSGEFTGLLFKTTDGGQNWTRLSNAPNYCGGQCLYNNAIAVHPTNPNVLFAGGQFPTLFRSLDGGVSWTDVTTGSSGVILHPDLHALAFSKTGDILYVGNDGGIWSTTGADATINWADLNSTLAITQFYTGISIKPSDVNFTLAGTQDEKTLRYTGSLSWDTVTSAGDGGATAIDFTVPTNVYAISGGFAVLKSTSSGDFGTWFVAMNGITSTDLHNFLPPLVMDPSNSLRLYLGTVHIYQTNDGAGSWAVISPDLGDEPTSIAVAKSNSNVVYVGTDLGHVFKTTNATSGTSGTWSEVTNGLLGRSITQIKVDPKNSSIAYLTLSGFLTKHVFKTTNGGGSWSAISGNLPDIPANDLVIDPDVSNSLYVATDIGVFRTSNGGSTWSVLGGGLPKVAVLGLELHRATRTLRAATHGRSAWDIHMPIADLVTLMTENPNPVLHGTNLKYTLTITNQGPDVAINTVVSDATPVGTTFVSFTTSTGTCTAPAVGATGTLKCKVGNLAKGAAVTVTLTVKDTAAAGSTLTDTGRASSSTPDPKTTNNAVTVKTSVD